MSSHIYWRVLFTKPPGAAKARSISRLQMHPIVNGINLCVTGNGQISARTEAPPKKNDTFVAYNAVSNNPLADWMSEKISDFDWIKWTFNTPREILEIQLTASRDKKRVKNAPQDFQLQWSDDDIEWNTVFIVLGELDWGPGEARRFSYEILTTTIGQAYTKALALPVTPFTDHLLAGEHDTASALTTHRNKTVSLAPAESSEVVHPIRVKGTWYIPLNSAPELDTPGTMTVKVTDVLIEPTLEPSGAISLVVKRSRPLSLIQANEEDTARSITNVITVPIGQAAETEVAHSISRGTINIALGGAASYNEASPFSADKRPQFSGAVFLNSALILKYARRITLQKAVESDTTLSSATTRVVQIGTALESNTVIDGIISRIFTLGLATSPNVALPFKIKRGNFIQVSTEKNSALPIRGSRDFPFNQAASLSSAQPIGYSTSIQLGIAVSLSYGNTITPPRAYTLGVASEKDATTSMFRCPIFEKDSAYSIERGFPDIIKQAHENDQSPRTIRPVRKISLLPAIESNTSSGSIYTQIVTLNLAVEGDESNTVSAERSIKSAQATTSSDALLVNKNKSKTLSQVGEKPLALRVYPPFSGTLGIGHTIELGSSFGSSKVRAIVRINEQDTATIITPEAAHALGVALEDDIARLYEHFIGINLRLREEKSIGLSIQPLRTKQIGQSASKDEGRSFQRDRDIPVNLASVGAEAFPFVIHVSDQFNQAVEGEVARYVRAVKGHALKLATEDDSVHVLAQTSKAHGINLGAEKDAGLAIRTAFAYDFNSTAEKNTAGSMSVLKTAILGYADSGKVAYALDKFLKVQGLNPAQEQDVALIPTANLTKELKKAFEYDEAQRQDASRIQFLRVAATSEMAHALGQTMKRQLIRLVASSSDAPYMIGEQPDRNRWQATVSTQESIEFAVGIRTSAEYLAPIHQEINFIVDV